MRIAAPLLCLALAFHAAACSSGGGGGGGAAVPMLPTPDPLQVDPPDLAARQQQFAGDPEFTRQPALEQIGAGYAYARGATGAGETLVFVDNGIQTGHREFTGKQVQISAHPDTPTYRAGISNSGHGTATAGIAAARRDSATALARNMHGVAFDADVHMVNIPLGTSPPFYTPLSLLRFGAEDERWWEALLGHTAGQGAIVNLSLGFAGAISEPAYTRDAVRRRFARTAAAQAQAGTPDADKTIFVWAAGNAGSERIADGSEALSDAPEILAGLGVHFPELRSHVLAVAAVQQDGSIAFFSNHCGIAKAFCLAAPGSSLAAPRASADSADGYRSFSGTSAAAPVVSGALAVLRQRFRNEDGSYALGNTELVARLLATADRSGIYANSDIYGQGLLDLDAATRPSGATRLLTGVTLSGPAAPESLSALTPGAAFGNALSVALSRHSVAAFDALDAPFRRELSSYLPPAAPRRSLPERLRALGDDPRGALLGMAGGGALRLRASRAAGASDALGAAPLAQPDVFGADLHSPFHQAGQASPAAARLDSLWLSQPIGAGADVFLGLRGHPGWDFGLHAAGAVAPGQFSAGGAFASPYLSFARAGGVAGVAARGRGGVLRAAAFRGGAQWGAQRDADTAEAFGGVLEFSSGGRAGGAAGGAALLAGVLREPERLVGSRLRGAFGGGGGRSWFAGASAHWPLFAGAPGKWGGFAALHAGYTRTAPRGARAQTAMLAWQTPLWTGAWGVGVAGRDVLVRRDRLSLRLSQPLRVERGRAALRWVSGRNRDGSLRFGRADAPLSPTGRQLEAELSYERSLSGGLLNLSAIGTRHPGHDSAAAAEFSLLLRYARLF